MWRRALALATHQSERQNDRGDTVKQFDNDAQDSTPTRREFCVGAGRAVSLAGLAVLMPGCGGSSPSAPSGNVSALTVVSAPVSNGVATLTIDSSSPLNAVGGAALVQTSSGNLLVTRTAQDTFAAFTATCTHEACTITGFRDQLFVCPCHGSQFNASGRPVSGPASRTLRQYTTAFSGSALTIAL
jgi:Rieske Fe-S protein